MAIIEMDKVVKANPHLLPGADQVELKEELEQNAIDSKKTAAKERRAIKAKVDIPHPGATAPTIPPITTTSSDTETPAVATLETKATKKDTLVN